MPKNSMQFRLKTSVMALAMLGLPFAAQAAGVGKLTVLSALGQPLRAEIELSASKDELSSITAKVASSDQFRQQGVEYSPVLGSVRLSVEKRANGQPYVRMTTDRPLNEPFLDVLVELAWASGRLVREYTFLLDPPDLPRKSPAVINVPESGTTTANPVSNYVPAPAPVAEAVAQTPSNREATGKAAKAGKAAKGAKGAQSTRIKVADEEADAKPAELKPAAPAPSATSTDAVTRQVKRGDTLGKIATETAPEGVSLDQMLVAIFAANKDAFDGNNLHRLKAGKILTIPDREAASAVSESEARKNVAVHSANFNAYRKKLAESAAGKTVAEEAPTQSAAGKIAPKVEDKAPPAPVGKDKLEVSRTEASKDAKAGKLSEEDRIAKEKALKEAQGRVAELEKNVADLKKLNEIKSQSLAEVQKQAAAKVAEAKPVAPATPPKVEPAKVEAPKPVENAKPAETPKPADAPKADAKPVDAAPPPVAEKPADAAPPPPKPKKVIPLPEPEPEPTFVEENGPLVYGGGGLLAVLFGLLGYRAIKRKRESRGEIDSPSQFSEAISTSSVFGTTGGQSVDTNNVSMGADFSQSSLTGTDTSAGVDPVAEAEVYMAYGRDAQAEEILLEALKAEPTRLAVHLKLLELYAARKTLKPFEEVARDLQTQTGGTGGTWEQATALGRQIDPTNPLYGGSAADVSAEAESPFGTSTVILPPGELAKMVANMDQPAAEPVAETATSNPTLDFDLDLGAPTQPGPEIEAAPAAPAVLDFDLDLDATSQGEPISETGSGTPSLDVEFDLGTPEANSLNIPETPAALTTPAAPSGNEIDFDFNLETPAASPALEKPSLSIADESTLLDTIALDAPILPAVEASPSVAPAPIDFGGLSLDLETPAVDKAESLSPVAEPVESAPVVADEAENPEVATKLELAQAYEEMGDKEGVRELLQEVLAEGSAGQKALAEQKLAQLGL